MKEKESNKDHKSKKKIEKKDLFLYSCPMCNKDTFHETGLKLWCDDCHTPIVEYD